MKIERFNTFINEGISRQGDKFTFDFSGDKEGDIMSLRFTGHKAKSMNKDGVKYEYYFAYEFDSKLDKELLKAVKKIDDKVDPKDATMMVNKAVIGFDDAHGLNTFDTIVYPKSSSVILKQLADQCNKKSGNATMVPDAFVKATRSEIKFDMDAINKLPDSTRKQVMKMVDSVKGGEGEFKLKDIFSRFRKFIKDFVIFNTDGDRRVHNAIVGKKVLLIDDYRTTGTTLKEMMNQLIKLQPEEIVVLIFIKVV